jgi:hypothetical protein
VEAFQGGPLGNQALTPKLHKPHADWAHLSRFAGEGVGGEGSGLYAALAVTPAADFN